MYILWGWLMCTYVYVGTCTYIRMHVSVYRYVVHRAKGGGEDV